MWHYQAVVQEDGNIAIHEYYPDMDTWTVNPVTLSAESKEELEWMLNSMLDDLESFGVMEV